jgi:hypothetical protein
MVTVATPWASVRVTVAPVDDVVMVAPGIGSAAAVEGVPARRREANLRVRVWLASGCSPLRHAEHCPITR